MAISKDKKYLLKDLVLKRNTSCSIDEAVGMMLGILKGPDWYHDVDYEEAKGDDDYIFDLSEYLTSERRRFQQAYCWDVDESKDASDNELAENLAKIEDFDTNFMKKAKVYLCLIEDELSKGEKSKLRTIDNGYGVKEITLASLDEWWRTAKSKTFEDSIFKDMESNVPKVRDDENDKELSLNANVTFGLLLRAFAKEKKLTKSKTPDKVEISEIAGLLQDLVSNLCDIDYGQGNTSIRSRLTAAENALENFIKKYG